MHNAGMLNVHELKAQDLQRLSPGALAEVAMRMLEHLAQQGQQVDFQAHTIRLRDINIDRITHELARLKAWRFGAKTERMSAEQLQVVRGNAGS